MVLGACLLASACSKFDEDQAEEAEVGLAEQSAGPTPFIANVALKMKDFDDLDRIAFTVAPKPGTFSKPVAVTYTRAWLERNGAWRPADKRLAFAVFGLYAGYQNAVSITATFHDNSTHALQVAVATPAYTGPGARYSTPQVRTARSATAVPGFDYMMLQNGLATPAVLDTDGNLRWLGARAGDSLSSVFKPDSFYVGSQTAPELFRLRLDGTYTSARLASARYTNFHHDLALGKFGLLAEVDAQDGGIRKIESILAEVGPGGEVLKEWDLNAIFRSTMQAGGDDPSNFVRDGVDWFHMNSAVYVPADDSLLISSRENFVVKLDYASGRIKWLLGDTSKHWYVDYPSLRALALKLKAGKPPVGQHALSMASNGELLLFNNGLGSANQPPGTAPGVTRDYSTPSRYTIDETARTAAETWAYSPTPAIFSDICSSVYESAPGHFLVTYSVAAGRTVTKLIGVDTAGKVAFDFEYPAEGCAVAFIGESINFANLILK
ncbi:aryl-sulfate sulfotransferase [Massilia sp. Dwa41.01b]|uniref:aryl-sulfate sulfotransferase n=1 Tax=unclassified Massilia TaxID=2609279 RepID=UPI001601A426|nr:MULTISPECIES: aryl-sulfate sulfotransferase [unclassified Massilia]QNA88789.1 aryl-sulfate sulfotransferase [Massilia sp. Dwa41.01b]QNA99687.1 aryl-sulfate sulfotransferase [Massilia sp. Se16.2.3]